MKTKGSIGLLMSAFCTFCFISCDNNNEEGRKITDYKEYVLTVASEKVPGVLWSDGLDYLSEVYAVKKEQSEEWSAFGAIDGFEFEKGYEYKIRVGETSYLDYSMGQPAWDERELLEVISKDKKNSEGLPLHFIPETYYGNVTLPEYIFHSMCSSAMAPRSKVPVRLRTQYIFIKILQSITGPNILNPE